MAQKTVIQLTDDLDGSDISGSGETVSFALDGVSYQIDLSETNAGKLRDVLRALCRGSTPRAERRLPSQRSTPPAAKPRDAQAIRRVGPQNGYEVSERGRISAAVLAAYEASRARRPDASLNRPPQTGRALRTARTCARRRSGYHIAQGLPVVRALAGPGPGGWSSSHPRPTRARPDEDGRAEVAAGRVNPATQRAR